MMFQIALLIFIYHKEYYFPVRNRFSITVSWFLDYLFYILYIFREKCLWITIFPKTTVLYYGLHKVHLYYRTTVSVPSYELGPPSPSPASVSPGTKGAGGIIASRWGGGGVTIRATGEKPSTLCTLLQNRFAFTIGTFLMINPFISLLR
jgi:hypothetical protein